MSRFMEKFHAERIMLKSYSYGTCKHQAEAQVTMWSMSGFKEAHLDSGPALAPEILQLSLAYPWCPWPFTQPQCGHQFLKVQHHTFVSSGFS